LSWLSDLTEGLGLRRVEPRHRLHALRYRNLVGNIRRLCELSDEAQGKLFGGWVMDRRYLASFVQGSLELGEEIFFDASVLAPGHRLRYSALDALRTRLSTLLSGRVSTSAPVLVTPLEEADRVDEDLVGVGPRLLAEAARRLGTPLSRGFVLTSAAIREDQPDPLRQAIGGALEKALEPGEAQEGFLLLSTVSGSPVEVERGPVATTEAVREAWRRVKASAPGRDHPAPGDRGSSAEGAVVCVLEGEWFERGTLHTSDRDNPLTLRLEVSSGEQPGTHVFERLPVEEPSRARVPEDYRPLVRMALALERLAGRPQAVAWSRGSAGFTLLHTSAVVFSDGVEPPGPRVADALKSHELIARSTGESDVAGVAAGPLRHVRCGEDLAEADDSSVLVLHRGAPSGIDRGRWQHAAALLVEDAAAAETWRGLARDARLPLLAGLDRPLDELPDGTRVTVDGHEGTLHRGIVRELLLHQLVGPAGGPEETELRLLGAIVQAVGRPRHGTPGGGRGPGLDATLFELIQEAHTAALRSFESLAYGAWGVPSGKPLAGANWPGTLRVVDVGVGADRAGGDVWPTRKEAGRLRCLPLRVFLEAFTNELGRGGSTARGVSGLAIVTEDSLTLHVESGEGSIVIDAVLNELPGSGSIHCAFGLGKPAGSDDALEPLGFSVVGLGSFEIAWLSRRAFEETRRGLRGLSQAVARLLRPAADDSPHPAGSEVADRGPGPDGIVAGRR
jgi:phosphohistidine swiveling domain-containing protein